MSVLKRRSCARAFFASNNREDNCSCKKNIEAYLLLERIRYSNRRDQNLFTDIGFEVDQDNIDVIHKHNLTGTKLESYKCHSILACVDCTGKSETELYAYSLSPVFP